MTMVRDIMSCELVSVHVDQSLVEAAVRMRDAGVGALMAVDGDEFVGVVTARDLVVRGLARHPEPGAAAVIDVMTRHVVFCRPEASVAEALGLMARQKIQRLAIVNGDRELVGVLSLGDLMRHDEPASAILAGGDCRHLRADRHGKAPRPRGPEGRTVARIAARHAARLRAPALHPPGARVRCFLSGCGTDANRGFPLRLRARRQQADFYRKMVGHVRFELTTPSTPCWCATRLR
jgi:CBS domain-containing protein